MTINAFEGARRITKLVAALWILGWIVAAFTVEAPLIDVNYTVSAPGQAPTRSVTECGSDGKEFVAVRTKKGTAAWATLCFVSEKPYMERAKKYLAWLLQNKSLKGSAEFETVSKAFVEARRREGERLYRYRANQVDAEVTGKTQLERDWLAAAPVGKWTSPEVMAYTTHVKETFVLSQADEAWIDRQWWFEYLKQVGVGALAVIGGLLFLWAFSWATGWIVRGFLGIPRGQDHRPSAPQE